jgi:hypothetical protein
MTAQWGCFRCNGLDHWADSCPELMPVTTKAEHEARIAKYVEWLVEERRITVHQKRALIEAENARWKETQKEKTGARK